MTFKELAKTLSTLLNRLEKTEKELKDMDKNIAEAENKEKELKDKIRQEKERSEEDSSEESEGIIVKDMLLLLLSVSFVTCRCLRPVLQMLFFGSQTLVYCYNCRQIET